MQYQKPNTKYQKEVSLVFGICTLVLLSSCVPVPPGMLPQTPGSTATATSYPDVDPGGTALTTIHFAVRGYSDADLRTVSSLAEGIYNRIGTDTGLYSYLAGQTFAMVVYKDQAEYATKTKQTSPLRAVIAGNTLYTYPGPDLEPMLAHQLMHLIFNTYMGSKASSLNWLNEGLAMYEEHLHMAEQERLVYETTQSNKLRHERQAFSQMTLYTGSEEDRRRQDIWYLQAESVVNFMLRQGNSLVFAAFLNDLRNGADLDHALSDSFANKYRNTTDLETSWISSL
jgi:hypothetical protein